MEIEVKIVEDDPSVPRPKVVLHPETYRKMAIWGSPPEPTVTMGDVKYGKLQCEVVLDSEAAEDAITISGHPAHPEPWTIYRRSGPRRGGSTRSREESCAGEPERMRNCEAS